MTTTTTTLLIARHGNTFGPNETVTYVGGRTDLPLVESGKEQAKAIGRYLKDGRLIPDVIYSSALQRTQDTAKIAVKASPLKNLEGQMNAAKGEITKLQEFARPLTKATEEREYWSKAIDDLNQRLPDEFIWITAFEPPTQEEIKKLEAEKAAAGPAPKSKGKSEPETAPVIVQVRGIYLSRDAGNNAGPAVVDTFVENLRQSPYFDPITEGAQGFERKSDDTPEWGFKFAIPMKLKNPIDLK